MPAPPPTEPARADERPRLLPSAGWARWALVAILALTFARGALWAVTTPSFWGPDEDYHAMYADTIAREGRLIDPDRPLYSNEYSATLDATEYDIYGSGGQRAFSGDPKTAIERLSGFPDAGREGTQEGRGIGVVHPPGYYAAAAAADRAMLGAALPTRLLWMRIISALFGVLAVYATWLLGSVVLRRRAVLPLLAALLVALQPMLAFFSGLVSNDVATTATFTLALAFLAFVLTRPAAPRQGLWVGGTIALALAMKATSLALLPLAAIAFALQGWAYGGWRGVGRSAGLAALAVLALIGWWYVYVRLSYGTFTGEVLAGIAPSPGAVVASLAAVPAPAAPAHGLDDYVAWTREWLADAYKTGWFHYLNFDAPRGRWFYFLPGGLIAICTLGLGGLLWTRRRTLRAAEHPLVRQLIVLGLATPALVLPFLAQDVMRRADGLGFLTNAGRFVLPAYPAAVVCALCGLLWLLRRQAQPLALGALAVTAGWFCWLVWHMNYVERYFGKADLGEQLRRMSFDRPAFVTATSLWLWLALTAGLAIAAGTALAWGAWRGTPEGAPAPRYPSARTTIRR